MGADHGGLTVISKTVDPKHRICNWGVAHAVHSIGYPFPLRPYGKMYLPPLMEDLEDCSVVKSRETVMKTLECSCCWNQDTKPFVSLKPAAVINPPTPTSFFLSPSFLYIMSCGNILPAGCSPARWRPPMRVPAVNSHPPGGGGSLLLAAVHVCYKQPVSIYLGKRNNVGKTAEDPPWARGGLKEWISRFGSGLDQTQVCGPLPLWMRWSHITTCADISW